MAAMLWKPWTFCGKIGGQNRVHTENINVVKEGTIFMELSVLFGVFDDIFKRPECDMNSHVHLKKKMAFPMM